MIASQNFPNRIEDFISAQVISRGLDERTAAAYRMDLEKFYLWPETSRMPDGSAWEERMEAYLEYLSRERGLRYSTLFRKQKVFGYYLSYLVSRGVLENHRPLKQMSPPEKADTDTLLTKKKWKHSSRLLIRSMRIWTVISADASVSETR